jgi:hypothetical protein
MLLETTLDLTALLVAGAAELTGAGATDEGATAEEAGLGLD